MHLLNTIHVINNYFKCSIPIFYKYKKKGCCPSHKDNIIQTVILFSIYPRPTPRSETFWLTSLEVPDVWHYSLRSIVCYNQTAKSTVIRRIAVQETSVSRHHREPIEGLLKPLDPSEHYRIEEFKRGP